MAAGRRCLDCPRIIPAGKPRCPDCTRTHDQARGTRQARGYDAHHDRLRAHYQRRMNAGETFHCWRPDCRLPIDPDRWHLGHDDHDRTKYRGPECVECNTATASRR